MPDTPLNINDFNYELPEERIAKYPLPERDLSKLLISNDEKNSQDVFRNLVNYLPPNTLMVFNNSRVIPARLVFRKKTGARIEIFLLEPVQPSDYQHNLSNNYTVLWKCIVGNLKKWKTSELTLNLLKNNQEIILNAKLVEDHQSHQLVLFRWNDPHIRFIDLLDIAGMTPIPPYLQREAVDSDRQWYQTIYSRLDGSVAAPTAGLHFSPDVFKDMESSGIPFCEVTLHVGAGTFQPVRESDVYRHHMHTEHFTLTRKFLETLLNHDGPVTAVGTTTVRTLESIYWLGVQTISPGIDRANQYEVKQWDGFKPSCIGIKTAISSLLESMEKNGIENLTATTSLMIAPGYRFRSTDCMITNFHQPRSTLLLLIAAFVGNRWKDIYEYALENNFRFLSYGDSSIIFPS